jgi:hypothetical protein
VRGHLRCQPRRRPFRQLHRQRGRPEVQPEPPFLGRPPPRRRGGTGTGTGTGGRSGALLSTEKSLTGGSLKTSTRPRSEQDVPLGAMLKQPPGVEGGGGDSTSVECLISINFSYRHAEEEEEMQRRLSSCFH